ncbi:MAG: gamma-glutamyltransferase family protein [Rubrivivax sp.]|nr:gamma-glutamyltransferase family protein [Rubrivivax sp.]
MNLLFPLALAAALWLGACATPPRPVAEAPPAMPEVASGATDKAGWRVRRQAVAAANPLAAEAGHRMLRAGGSALDAAVAVQMVLTLVEPQSSGIGGGAFLLHWDGRAVQAWDGRETAPAAADERLFLQPDGQPLPMLQAIVGGRPVGVPGVVRMLEAAHRDHGRLPWAQLLQPAIELAEAGFAVSPRLFTQLQGDPALRQDRLAAAYFYRADGQPHPVGHRLRNPALATVLRAIAAQGSAALHQGPVAADIVARVRAHPSNPGRLSAADLAGYQPRLREALCTDWGARWRVCGMPPPSSGHLAVMQILGLLDRMAPVALPLQAGVPGPDWLHAYAEAARLAFADRAQFVADPDFVTAPAGRWGSLLDDAYLRQRAALVGPRSLGTAPAGRPGGAPLAFAPQPAQPEAGTSHLSIVDAEGRAVAMTTSIEAQFGARLMSDGGTGLPGGFLLNNQLTDFSFVPADAQGRPVANRVQAGKRPRSSMSPTLVFDRGSGQLQMVLGSPGGAAIIHFTARTLIAARDWGLDVQQAIALPNFGSFNGPATVLERGRFPEATRQALRSRGHQVVEADLPSGLQALQRTPEGWFGGADPRREGVVSGD